jgi:hypothetical protein
MRLSVVVWFAARGSTTLVSGAPLALAVASASFFPTTLYLALCMTLNRIALFAPREHSRILRVLWLASCVIPENISGTAFQLTSTTVSLTVSSALSGNFRQLPVRRPALRAKAVKRLLLALPVVTAVRAATFAVSAFPSLAAKVLTVPVRDSASRALPATNVLAAPIGLHAQPAATKGKQARQTASLAQLVLIKRSVRKPPVLTARGVTSVRLVAPTR